MKRIVARFENGQDADAESSELREAGLEPESPAIDNPFFDPTARVPEERWLVVGAIAGGLIGLFALQAINMGLLWVPRTSPLMSAGDYAVPTLGLGLGVVFGAFLGGVIGTLQPVAQPDESELAVEAPDDRIDETEELLYEHDATEVDGTVTYHENPGKSSQ